MHKLISYYSNTPIQIVAQKIVLFKRYDEDMSKT